MKTIKFLGNWNGNCPKENAAMGLVPGQRYVVAEYYECEGNCPTHNLLPRVRNEQGKLTDLCHGEYVEEDSNGQ